ncbi:MAG: outer membrane beta-barrel family protein [Muribaculaceae bacterium]|nr:outer membrane beta-barrel family protein [Muribaculaceae bacterium]
MAQSADKDSVRTKNLDEVVVEAQMQRTSPISTTYIPTGKQKNASQNAVDLLRQMAIPQIRINPVSDAVTDNAGGNVAVFINYLEASKGEMEGLRTADVRKVEYLEFPSDPRFRGEQRVINIIVQEYAYGGYTKLNTSDNFMSGFSSRNNIFSKFSYRKVTYDIYAAANYWNNHHIGNTLQSIYTLNKDDGGDYRITRTESVEKSHYRQSQYPLTFRATYASEKIQIRNTLGFTHTGTPFYDQHGALTYQPGNDRDYTFDRTNPSRNNSLAYQGSFFVAMPNQFSIDISPRFNYSHINDGMRYSTSNTPEIIRIARENAYNYRVNVYLHKSFGKKHTVMLGGNGGDNINRLRYTGSSSYYDRFHNAFAAGMLCYNFKTQMASLYADLGYCWEGSDINKKKYNDTYPFTHINLRYAPNSRNAFSAYFQYATNSPGINEKASDILQDNEYMYLTGNPLLENSRHITLNLSYTWMPSNYFALSAFNNFFEIIDKQIVAYQHYNNGSSLLRNYINNGNYIQNEIGLSANWKLLDGKLQLYVSPEQKFFKSTGVYSKSYNPFSILAQATYYLNNLYFQVFYQTPDKQMFSSSPQIYKDRNFHSLIVGWANSDWNIRLMVANVFNKGWVCAETIIESPLYTEFKEQIGTSSHPRLNIAVTYTFGYGKKVQRGNEVGEQSGSSSAIIK